MSAPLTVEQEQEVVVSVVIPCLNEELGVGKCVEKARRALAAMDVAGEVIVVDNGSTDGSVEIAERSGARVVAERRRGYGSAYQRGLAEARGRYIVIGDADDTYDFTKIGDFIEILLRGDCDMVMGSRLKGTILPGAMSWSHRWIGNPILSGMLRLLFHTRISDTQCGMRAFTREAYQRIRPRTTGMEFASELIVNALRSRLRISEIPITYHPREGESKLEGLSDAWRHVRFMLLFSPSYLFQLPGLVLLSVGLALVALLATGPREILGREWDYHVLMFGTLAVILGYTLVLFDICAKVFCMGAGFAEPKHWLRTLGRIFSLERGLIVAALLFAVGVATLGSVVIEWAQSGYGPLAAIRGMVLGSAAVVLGLQTAFASFLVSLMLIPRS